METDQSRCLAWRNSSDSEVKEGCQFKFSNSFVSLETRRTCGQLWN